jgi:uncharacterized membrane protein YbhN (UPF0104 family)
MADEDHAGRATPSPSRAPQVHRFLTAIRGAVTGRSHPVLRRLLTVACLCFAGGLLYCATRSVQLSQVPGAIAGIGVWDLAGAAAATVFSYGVYSSVDLFSRPFVHPPFARRINIGVAFVVYSFTLNLGSLVGSFGLRLRLYSRFGLRMPQIARVIGLSFVTNWSGYFLVAGLAFSLGFADLPEHWRIGAAGLRYFGLALLLALAAYLGACAFAKRRHWTLRKLDFHLPGLGFAVGQVSISSVNWLVIAGVIDVLLQERVPYASLLAVFLLSSVATLVTHVPGGIGVIEAVFLGLLGHRVPHPQLFGALLVFRAMYYLLPLALGFSVYLWLESHARATPALSSPAP